MSEKNIIAKCDECGGSIDTTAVKGKNNTYLCGGNHMKGPGKCGHNTCFVCGKVETGTEWVQGYDCQGNCKMVEQKKGMFTQEEKDEKDSDRKLRVKYCDEHKAEALKSPLIWTKEDSERIEKQEEQKELEIEQKLNSQKGLFYCKEPFPRSVEWKREQLKGIVEYGCVYFWGQENGQNFFLMIPDTHPVLNDLKYTKKIKDDDRHDGQETEYTCYNLEKQFYTIEGVDNLPLETTDSKYEGNDPYAKAYRFNKFVGLSDKIKLIPVDSQGQPEKNKPVENKSPNGQNNQSPFSIPNSIKEYFQKNNVKSIEWKGNHFLILYNDEKKNNGIPSLTLTLNNPIFQELKDHFSKTNKNVLTRQELNLDTSSDTTPTTKPKNNAALWISCGIGGGIIIAVIIGLLIRRKKRVKKG